MGHRAEMITQLLLMGSNSGYLNIQYCLKEIAREIPDFDQDKAVSEKVAKRES